VLDQLGQAGPGWNRATSNRPRPTRSWSTPRGASSTAVSRRISTSLPDEQPWTVAEGTGTGELAGLRGEGGYLAAHGEAEIAFELRWSLEGPPG